MFKKFAEFIGSTGTVLGALLIVFSVGFWYSATIGSWQSKIHGCLELDIRPTLEGVLVSGDGRTLTKLSGGFSILNWITFEYQVQENYIKTTAGLATGFINPFTRTMTLRYKEQSEGAHFIDGYRETVGIEFLRKADECTSGLLVG